MPVSYRIDLNAGVVFTVSEGRLTYEELLDHQQRLSSDPDFRPTMNHVIDVRGVTERAVTAFGVRTVAISRIFAPGSRRAIITGDDGSSSSYGYVRMFQTLRSQSGVDIRIFSTVEDAHRWLGLESHRSPEL
jgi:hypothetical protein